MESVIRIQLLVDEFIVSTYTALAWRRCVTAIFVSLHRKCGNPEQNARIVRGRHQQKAHRQQISRCSRKNLTEADPADIASSKNRPKSSETRNTT